jgi:hypothetical protein
MNKTTKNIINSFIMVPIMTTTMSMSAITTSINSAVASLNQTQADREEIKLEKEREIKSAKIDAYFAKRDMPLAGYGMEMVLASEKHNLDWRLIPAIAVRESTGGKFACLNNPFGWGSCKIGFKNFSEAIQSVTEHLSGDNPRTARYYEGKNVKEILVTYNPPSVIPKYADQVIDIMETIEGIQV